MTQRCGSLSRLNALKSLPMVQTEQVEFRGRTVAVYVGGAVLFGLGVWAAMGPLKAEEYFAGYLLEQSLSVDNLFVFILVFNYFQTPLQAQGKVRTAMRKSLTFCIKLGLPCASYLL